MSNITYTQKIFAVDVLPEAEGLSNVIGRVKWEYRAHDGVHVAWTTHTTDLAIPKSENFVSFDDVTEEIVLGWVNDVVDLTLLQAELDLQLQESISEFLEKDPPWETFGDNVLTRNYVLVHQGEVVWGPMRWNTFGINRELDELGLSVVLPNVIPIIPETQPLIVGEDTLVCRVLDVQTPNYNPDFEVMSSDIDWDFSTGVAVGSYTIQDRPIEEIKEFLLSIAHSEYILDKLVVITSDQGTKYTLTEGDIVEFQINQEDMNDTETISWIDGELNLVEIDKQQIQWLISQYASILKTRRSEFFTVKSQINSASSIEDLKNLFEQLVN